MRSLEKFYLKLSHSVKLSRVECRAVIAEAFSAMRCKACSTLNSSLSLSTPHGHKNNHNSCRNCSQHSSIGQWPKLFSISFNCTECFSVSTLWRININLLITGQDELCSQLADEDQDVVTQEKNRIRRYNVWCCHLS